MGIRPVAGGTDGPPDRGVGRADRQRLVQASARASAGSVARMTVPELSMTATASANPAQPRSNFASSAATEMTPTTFPSTWMDRVKQSRTRRFRAPRQWNRHRAHAAHQANCGVWPRSVPILLRSVAATVRPLMSSWIEAAPISAWARSASARSSNIRRRSMNRPARGRASAGTARPRSLQFGQDVAGVKRQRTSARPRVESVKLRVRKALVYR